MFFEAAMGPIQMTQVLKICFLSTFLLSEQDHLDYNFQYPEKMLFVLCHSNPEVYPFFPQDPHESNDRIGRYSPLVEKVEVVRHGKVRRAKLYYLRGLSAKKARIKEKRTSKDKPQENN